MKKYLLIILLPVIVISCKKNPGNPVVSISSEQYFPPKAGNYWVYEGFDGDTLGNFVDTHGISDSIYYAGDTAISGNTYHVFCNFVNNNFWMIWRDSSGFMVNQHGTIELSTANFSDILQTDSTYNIEVKYKMINNLMVSTPAGSFNTIAFTGTIIYTPYFTPNAKCYYSYNYASGVGLVMYHTFFISQPNTVLEKRLIRYHVQ